MRGKGEEVVCFEGDVRQKKCNKVSVYKVISYFGG